MPRPRGLATLSAALASKNPRKPLSAPNAHGFSPSELSSDHRVEKRFPFFLSVLALPFKTSSASNVRFDDLAPMISRIPCCPRMFSPGRNPGSPGFPASRALPPPWRDSKHLSSSLPSRLFRFNDLTITETQDLRVFTPRQLGLLPS